MLGGLTGRDRWRWSAFGKHPAVRDYFQINLISPLATALAQWVENGFRKVPTDNQRTRVCSWRMWARGTKKGQVLCGVGKSSSDSIGRPYPMVVMGVGGLPHWEKHWHLLPFGLCATWDRMEYLSTRRLTGLDQLENEISGLAAPSDNWQQIKRRQDEQREMDGQLPNQEIILSTVSEKTLELATEKQLTIALNGQPSDDPLQMAGAWHLAIKKQSAGIPSMVFMGGTTEKVFLVLFNRPLVSDDFLSLWTM